MKQSLALFTLAATAFADNEPVCGTVSQTLTYTSITLLSPEGKDLGFPEGLSDAKFGVGARLLGTSSIVDEGGAEGFELFSCNLLTATTWDCFFTQTTTNLGDGSPAQQGALTYQGGYSLSENIGAFVITGGAGPFAGATGRALSSADETDPNVKHMTVSYCLPPPSNADDNDDDDDK